MGARKAFNPATKRLVEYGLIGLAIGAVLIAGLQLRPQTWFPSQGILQINLTDGVPSVELSSQSPSTTCRGNCNATSVNVTITSIEVHTSGIDNMTGMWTSVCTKELPTTVDLVKVMNLVKNLCGASIQPDTITNVRMTVTSATAQISEVGQRDLRVPSGKLEVPLSPLAEVQAGKTTSITVDFRPHIVCTGSGNGDCLLTPVLHATSTGPA